MRSLTVEEARTIQAERRKKAVFSFALHGFCAVAIGIIACFTVGDKAGGRVFPLIVAGLLLYLALSVKLSGFYMLFRPKEFTGTVTRIEAKEETVKKYMSSQPGVAYTADHIQKMEILVTNEKGKTIIHKFVLTDDYKELKLGDNVTVLSFIDRPVINK